MALRRFEYIRQLWVSQNCTNSNTSYYNFLAYLLHFSLDYCIAEYKDNNIGTSLQLFTFSNHS